MDMIKENKIKKVALCGAGAVGASISHRLYRKYQEDFCLVAKGKRAERLRREGLSVNGIVFYPKVCEERNEEIDLLLVCVKNYHLDETLDELETIITERTIILPLLNGVTAVDRFKERFPNNKVLYGIVMRTDACRVDNTVTVSTLGELQFGHAKNDPIGSDILEIYFFLRASGLNPHVYADMERALWRKWMINIGSNQVSLLAEAKFKYFGWVEEIQELARASMSEIVRVAQAKGVDLTDDDCEEMLDVLINYPPEKKTSMLQDFEARRRTEIDCFAGTVVDYGKKYGVPTPVNQTLYYAIKARERVYLMKREAEERYKMQESEMYNRPERM